MRAGEPESSNWGHEDALPQNFMSDSFLNFDLENLGSQELTTGGDAHLPDNFDFWQDCLSSIENGGPESSNASMQQTA